MLNLYGWSDDRQSDFDQNHAALGHQPARVIEQQRGLFRIITNIGERHARTAGKLAHEAVGGGLPVAGDWVAITAHGADDATIHAVLTRSSAFTRSGLYGAGQVVAANLDVALLVSSLNGDLNPRRIERYLAVSRASRTRPVIVLTKADQCEDIDCASAPIFALAGDAPVLIVSALTGTGLDAVRAELPPTKTAALLGSSGVGKSTLLNALAGEQVMETQAISGDDKRGRHTTTHRELILLPSGALLLDSPGMRELGVWAADEGVAATFADIEAVAASCRFADCTHSHEPGCAVRIAIDSGELDESRWRAFGKLQRELAFEARKEDPRLRAETRKVWIQRTKNYRALKRSREDDD